MAMHPPVCIHYKYIMQCKVTLILPVHITNYYKKEQMLTNLVTMSHLPHTTLTITKHTTGSLSSLMNNTSFVFPLHLVTPFLLPICRTLPTLCRFSAITFTSRTPVSSRIHPILNNNYTHFSAASPSTTQNSELMTKNSKALCRLAENKTRQIGNLNTVNKMPHPGTPNSNAAIPAFTHYAG